MNLNFKTAEMNSMVIMNRNRNVRILFTTLLCCLSLLATAQIETEQVEVVKTFEITLEDAKKESLKPVIVPVTPIKKVYNYNVTIVPLQLKYPDPIIKPLSTPADDPFPTKSFYAKLGYGDVKNPFGQVRYSMNDSEIYDFSAYANFMAMDNSEEVAFQKMTVGNGGVRGKYRLTENMYLKASGDLDIQRRYFYFTPTSKENVNESDLKRNTGILTYSGGIQNVEETEADIDYEVMVTGHLVGTTNVGANQQDLGIKANVTKRSGSLISIDIPVEAMVLRYHTDGRDLTYTFKTLDFRPNLRYSRSKFTLNAGLALLVDDEKTRPWPNVDLAVGIKGNFIQAFAGTTQRAVTNDLRYTLSVSPWVESHIDSIRNIVNREYYGGIRGEFRFLSYQARAGYRDGINQPLYHNFKLSRNNVLVFDRPNQFYTNMDAVFINGNIDFYVSKVLVVGGVLTKNFYKLYTVKEAWSVPSLELNAYAKFNLLKDKLKLKSELYIADRTQTLYKDPTSTDLPQIFTNNNMVDLNAEVEIWPTKKFAIYAQANNILNNKYARWFGYQQIGIHFNGGIVLSL